MLYGYFDTSSTEVKSGITAMAGYIGDSAAWSALEEQWSRELSLWRIERFHRAEMKHMLGRERGELCIRAFAQLIRASSLTNVWAAVIDHDWDALAKPKSFSTRFSSSRHFCFEHVLSQLSVWCKDEARSDQLDLVFDDDMAPGAAEAIYAEYEWSSLHPNLARPMKWARSSSHFGIEVADLVAGAPGLLARVRTDLDLPKSAASVRRGVGEQRIERMRALVR